MALFPIQRGTISERLRRALGLVGPLPVQLDSNVAQTVSVLDATGAPWRREGLRWWIQTETTAPAGQLPMISLVSAHPGAVVVDRVLMGSSTSAPDYHIGWGTDVYFPPAGGQSSEVDGFDPNSVVGVPVRLLVASVNSPYAGAVPFYRQRSGLLFADIDQPLNAGPQPAPITTSMRFLNFVVQGHLYVTVTGRWFPSLVKQG